MHNTCPLLKPQRLAVAWIIENCWMNTNDLTLFLGCTVSLVMMSGENLKVRVEFVDEDDGTVIVAVMETSHPEHNRQPCAMRTFTASEIASATPPD
jgi:hypothetical protein